MGTLLGERIKRKEDPRLIQGRGHYVDDVKLDCMLHMAFARSAHAHARVKSVNVSAARAHPGVVAVYTGADLKGKVGLVPCAAGMEGLKVPDHPCLGCEAHRLYRGGATHHGRPRRAAPCRDNQ